MKEQKKIKTEHDGFWKRNWLLIAIVIALAGSGIKYMEEMYSISPYLLIIHAFVLYIAFALLVFVNLGKKRRLIHEIRIGGYNMWKALCKPLKAIAKKTASGLDLITQRMGADQEIAIAEKQKKKLEIELMQKKLKTEISRIDEEEANKAAPEKTEEKAESEQDTKTNRDPECIKYGETVIKYLKEVNWNAFTITQCQRVIHKRFGTAKLVLEILVDEGKLEHVNIGKRKAYRLASAGSE